MNRTGIFLAAAGVLALVALVAGFPQRIIRNHVEPVEPVKPVIFQNGTGSLTMTSRLSHPFVGTGAQDVFVTFDLKGAEVPGATRSAVNLALVIDRSGSMSGFKLNQAKLAARQLIAQLTADDRLAIVHYGSDVKSQTGLFATSENKARLLAYVDSIWDDGGTNIGAGLTAGRDLLLAAKSDFKSNRLILISDGQPTEGVTDAASLTGIARELRTQGITVSSIGVGTDFNEDLMQGFASVGGGAYAFLEDASQLASIFEKDLSRAGTMVARGVRLELRNDVGAELVEVFGHPASAVMIKGTVQAFDLPDFAAGQSDRIVAHFRTRPGMAGDSTEVVGVRLVYTDLLKSEGVTTEAVLNAQVTADASQVLKSQDKEATVFAARARSAVNTEKAAEFLKQGDQAGAKKMLDDNTFMFEQAAEVAGPAAVQGDLDSQRAMQRDFEGANTEELRQVQTKSAKRKARIDYGLSGSTY